MTGRHRGLKQKLRAGYRAPSLQRMYYMSSSSVADVIFFIVECGIEHSLYAVHVFEVRASSSSPRLPLCQISFLLQPPLLAELADGEKLRTQSLTHPAYLMPREPKRSALVYNENQIYIGI